MLGYADKEIYALTVKTLKRADEVSELWNGTLYQLRIDAEQKQIRESIVKNGVKKTRALVQDLIPFLTLAENEYGARGEH